MSEFKGTKGEHKPIFVSGICIGIGVELEPNYNQMIVNTILPDTDKEYNNQKEEIEANVKLYCAAPDLLEALINAVDHKKGWAKAAKLAILKALNINLGQ